MAVPVLLILDRWSAILLHILHCCDFVRWSTPSVFPSFIDCYTACLMPTGGSIIPSIYALTYYPCVWVRAFRPWAHFQHIWHITELYSETKKLLKELASRIISVLEKMPVRFNGKVMWSSFYSVNWPLISGLMPFIKMGKKKPWLLMWDLCRYLFSFNWPTWIRDYYRCYVNSLLTVDGWMVVVFSHESYTAGKKSSLLPVYNPL